MLKMGIILPDNEFRSALKRYCLMREDLLCLFAENTIEDAINNSGNINSSPDILLIEITPDNTLSRNQIDNINKQFYNPVIVVLHSSKSSVEVIKYLTWGIKGYILKKESPVDIVNKIKTIENGGLPLSSEAARGLVDYLQKDILNNNAVKNI